MRFKLNARVSIEVFGQRLSGLGLAYIIGLGFRAYSMICHTACACLYTARLQMCVCVCACMPIRLHGGLKMPKPYL